ncbi:MAG TPA: metallophosphoesterase [Thermoanaerobaculia bacterium]|nr:metallophosphoesterase [Thermoanaerobaculia bacterium]
MSYPRIFPRRFVPGAGRGRGFSRRRARFEHWITRLYRGGWPARLARAVGLQRSLAVRWHRFELPDWPAGTPPLQVAFASDFHAGPTTADALLAEAAAALTDAEPDLLLLGGDFVSYQAAHVDRVAPLLGRVPARLGRYAVLGNHDLWADDRVIVAALEAAGIEVLVNRAVALPPPWDRVSLVGLDDFTTGEPDPQVAGVGAAPFRLVLMHDPSTLLALAERRFALAFAGHTHGGQICLPGGFPLLVPEGPLARRYVGGTYHVGGGRRLLVSRGVGCGELPVRLFAPSEVHLCHLGPVNSRRPGR